MKRKLFALVGVSALVLAAGFVLAGCGNLSKSGSITSVKVKLIAADEGMADRSYDNNPEISQIPKGSRIAAAYTYEKENDVGSIREEFEWFVNGEKTTENVSLGGRSFFTDNLEENDIIKVKVTVYGTYGDVTPGSATSNEVTVIAAEQ